MSPEELAKCSRAYDVESEEFCSPIPTQNVSNGEYLPKPQTEKQQQVEARIKELADGAAKKLGVSRRELLDPGFDLLLLLGLRFRQVLAVRHVLGRDWGTEFLGLDIIRAGALGQLLRRHPRGIGHGSSSSSFETNWDK